MERMLGPRDQNVRNCISEWYKREVRHGTKQKNSLLLCVSDVVHGLVLSMATNMPDPSTMMTTNEEMANLKPDDAAGLSWIDTYSALDPKVPKKFSVFSLHSFYILYTCLTLHSFTRPT